MSSDTPRYEQAPDFGSEQPPTFTDAEASALLQLQHGLEASRVDESGKVLFHEFIMGATHDGTVVVVDAPVDFGSTDVAFVVRVGGIGQLVGGVPLAEERMLSGARDDIGMFKAELLRDGGTTRLATDFGTIYQSAPRFGELPSFKGNTLFPIGKDGRAFLTVVEEPEHTFDYKTEESTSVPLSSKEVSVGGLRRRLFGRHK